MTYDRPNLTKQFQIRMGKFTYDRPNLTKQFHTGNVCNQFDKYRSYMHAINLINIQAIYVCY